MMSEAADAPPAVRPRLRRRTEHRLVAGVAGGLADSLNAPVAFVRFMVGLAAWLVPWSLLAYAAAALLLPAAGRDRPDWDNLIGAARLGLLFAVPWLVLPKIVVNEPVEGPAGALMAAYGLVAAGAAVLLSADYVRGRPRSARDARRAVLAALPAAGCAAAIVLGIVLVPDVRWDRVAAVPAIAGGAALAVARRRELVAPAVVALGAAAVIAASDTRLEGGVGDLRLRPAGAVEPIVAKRAVGDVEVDLSRLRRTDGPVVVEAQTGYGDVEVTVPTRAAVAVDARTGQGSVRSSSSQIPRVEHYDHRFQGYDPRVRHEEPGRPGALHVTVIARAGSGDVDVWRGPR